MKLNWKWSGLWSLLFSAGRGEQSSQVLEEVVEYFVPHIRLVEVGWVPGFRQSNDDMVWQEGKVSD